MEGYQGPRGVQQLLVVAGVSCCGKTEFQKVIRGKKPEDGYFPQDVPADVRRSFHGDFDAYLQATKVKDHDAKRYSRVFLHLDLANAPRARQGKPLNPDTYNSWNPLGLVDDAKELIVFTLWCRREELGRRLLDKPRYRGGRNPNRLARDHRGRMYFCQTGGKRIAEHYYAWLSCVEQYTQKTRTHLVVDTTKKPVRIVALENWDTAKFSE